MSALLPPVPELIPIADLIGASRSSISGNSNMGEQRSRRASAAGKQQQKQQQQQQQRQANTANTVISCTATTTTTTTTAVIDSKVSRGACSADAVTPPPQPPPPLPPTRKPSERHRKLDRRREHTAATTRKHSSHHHHHHNKTSVIRHTNNNNNNNNTTVGGGSSAIGSEHCSAEVEDEAEDEAAAAAGEEEAANHHNSSSGHKAAAAAVVQVSHHQSARVNPIFVWVRQENSRIVDVKCEDYDKRNRILLTKTAQGWRAIPRTETQAAAAAASTTSRRDDDTVGNTVKQQLSSGAKVAAATTASVPDKVHRAHRRSSKVKRKSTAVQVDEDLQNKATAPAATTTTIAPEEIRPPEDWNDPVNIESHLPSHTILVSNRQPTTPATAPLPPSEPTAHQSATTTNIGVAVATDVKASLTIECPVAKICESSPLDNLLAVAELEFNQQFNQGRQEEDSSSLHRQHDETDEKEVSDYDENMEHLTSFINSCTAVAQRNAAETEQQHQQQQHIIDSFVQETETADEEAIEEDDDEEEEEDAAKETEDCDYKSDDDNTLAMDDILNRLEQSLRSPDTMNTDINEMLTTGDESDAAADITRTPEHRAIEDEAEDEEETELVDKMEDETHEEEDEEERQHQEEQTEVIEDAAEVIAEDTEISDKVDFEPAAETEADTPEEAIVSSTPDFPTDLSKKPMDDCGPTDLTVPKNKARSSPPPRPQSQSSETMQSPQPSGIPAVPPSPDIVQTPKARSVFLESMLNSAAQLPTTKPVSTTTTEEPVAKEPLNLGKNRESASPTVTCSEEVKSSQLSEDEPVYKKFRMEDITIKTLLDAETERNRARKALEEKKTVVETPKLLELLTNETEPADPVTQLKQLLHSDKIKIPDPMLIPKDRLSLVLTNPLKEIPRLLSQRPELRLPEVLDYPELLQDPNMLVITVPQLETIIYKQNHIPKEAKTSPPKQRSTAEKKASAEPKQHPQVEVPTKPNNISTKASNKERERETSAVNGEKTHHEEVTNDINAATNAMLNQMMWLPYLNQLEAMNYGANNNTNNLEFLKMLRTIMPPYAMMPDAMSQMMAANRFPMQSSGQHFPLPNLPNFNPEFAMWQEAMLQASLLRQRTPYELFNGNKDSREFSGKSTAPSLPPARTHQTTNKASSKQSTSNYAKANPYANVAAYQQQSSSRNTAATQQKSSSSRTSYTSQNNRTSVGYNNGFMDPYLSKDNYHKDQYNLQKDYLSKDNYLMQKQQQLQQQQQMSEYIKQQQQTSSSSRSATTGHHNHNSVRDAAYKSVSCKSFASMISDSSAPHHHQGQLHGQQQQQQHGGSRKSEGVTMERVSTTKHYTAPMDLSNITNPHSSSLTTTNPYSMSSVHVTPSNTPLTHQGSQQHQSSAQNHHNSTNSTTASSSSSTMGKIKVKQHLVDPNLVQPKLLKQQDDHGEVGSTTASIEEMQDAQKHLWHPLFGSQKSYNSPWNWTTVTATGE